MNRIAHVCRQCKILFLAPWEKKHSMCKTATDSVSGQNKPVWKRIMSGQYERDNS